MVRDAPPAAALQGRAAILDARVEWLAGHAPPQAFVGLFAAAGTEAFYRRFGFEVHAGLTGMFRTTPIEREFTKP